MSRRPLADVEHGTPQGYTRLGCRQQCCRDAIAAHEREVTRLKAYGRWQPFVDAGPVREHLATLQAAGIGQSRVAELSGLSCGVLARITYEVAGRERTRRVRPATRDAILSIDPGDPGVARPRAYVDGTGTARRLQGLVAAGHLQCDLAQRLGMEPSNFIGALTASQTSARVTAATRTAVRVLVADLAHVVPPDTAGTRRGRSRAARRGWVPAAAWDDFPGPHFIDDPAASPWTDAGSGSGAGSTGEHLSRDLLVAEARLVADEPFHVAAARIGISEAALERALFRAGASDLLAQLREASARWRRGAAVAS